MEFTNARTDDSLYAEERDEEDCERDERNKLHPFLPTTSSQPSTSTTSFPAPPTPTAPVEKEHMFEKVVTPSDVGKLNRLVIPKQHAEKYFPLDASTHDRGLLLNFEDRNGKPWHFRYSYWNSSQSYVMTKGWSRFVKEKRLDAGDTVLFCRGTGETASHRLFIDWKRRPENHIHRFPYQHSIPSSSSSALHPHPYLSFARSASAPWAVSRLFVPHAAASPASDYFYFRSSSAVAGPAPAPMVLDSIPVGTGKEAARPKRVRLFGVNLEQPDLVGVESSSAASSSSSAKDSRLSPPLDLNIL